MLNLKTIAPLVLTLAATAAGLAPSANAGSQHSNEPQIRYRQADLVTPKKAETILLRIHAAANDVCWQELGPVRHTEKDKLKKCLQDVTQDLVDQIDNKNLTLAQGRIPAPETLKRNKPKIQLALTEIDIK